MADVSAGPVLARVPGSSLIPSRDGFVDPAQVALDIGVDARAVWPATPIATGHDADERHLLVVLRHQGSAAVALK